MLFRSGRIETGILCLLVALCVVRFWLMPLPSSFWVDESVTAYVVQNPHDPSFVIAPQVPLSCAEHVQQLKGESPGPT